MNDEEVIFDKKVLVKLANFRMPFGKYAKWRLLDIPEEYFIWYQKKGFPEGKLGEYMTMMLDIKANGLEQILVPLKIKDEKR